MVNFFCYHGATAAGGLNLASPLLIIGHRPRYFCMEMEKWYAASAVAILFSLFFQKRKKERCFYFHREGTAYQCWLLESQDHHHNSRDRHNQWIIMSHEGLNGLMNLFVEKKLLHESIISDFASQNVWRNCFKWCRVPSKCLWSHLSFSMNLETCTSYFWEVDASLHISSRPRSKKTHD